MKKSDSNNNKMKIPFKGHKGVRNLCVARRPDIAKAKSELGWEPKVTLDEGLDHIIQYFREYLKL